ncbi:MAG: SCO family protein [Deltaproteobacteria bacterium]|nr:MAG: SCO family protein [Deltaproteobacteria bacterium]
MAVALVIVAAVVWRMEASRSALPGETSLEQLGDYGRVPAFSLTERSRRQVTRDDLRDHVSVIDFIYTDCAETCPAQSLEMAQLEREFEEARDLRLVSITVDPRHDTPEVLARYAQRYQADDRWWFLTGDQHTIYCLARDGFRLSVVDSSTSPPAPCGGTLGLGPRAAWASHGSKGLIMHSARLMLVDRVTRIRAYHLATDTASLQALRRNLRRLLAGR